MVNFALFFQGFLKDSSYYEQRTSSGFTSHNAIASFIPIETSV
ncbi:hypothetical protein [Nostoc sp.]